MPNLVYLAFILAEFSAFIQTKMYKVRCLLMLCKDTKLVYTLECVMSFLFCFLSGNYLIIPLYLPRHDP